MFIYVCTRISSISTAPASYYSFARHANIVGSTIASTVPAGLLFASVIEEWLNIDGVDKNDVSI